MCGSIERDNGVNPDAARVLQAVTEEFLLGRRFACAGASGEMIAQILTNSNRVH